MTEQEYRTTMANLTGYFGTSPNDIQYVYIWDEVKNLKNDRFICVCDDLIRTFKQTTLNPFPMICHFLESVKNTEVTYRKFDCISYKSLPDKSKISDVDIKNIDLWNNEMQQLLKNIGKPISYN